MGLHHYGLLVTPRGCTFPGNPMTLIAPACEKRGRNLLKKKSTSYPCQEDSWWVFHLPHYQFSFPFPLTTSFIFRHDYNIASQFPNDNGHLVSFCVCGHLTVDRRTKVLEPAVSGEEICQRILSTAAGHAAVCSSAPFVHTVDNDNDGTQLIMFCQVRNLFFWLMFAFLGGLLKVLKGLLGIRLLNCGLLGLGS